MPGKKRDILLLYLRGMGFPIAGGGTVKEWAAGFIVGTIIYQVIKAIVERKH